MGKILQARGDPVSGAVMIDQAVAIATRKGYNESLDRIGRRSGGDWQATGSDR